MASDQERDHALQALRSKLIESREWESKLKNLRLEIKGLQKDYDTTEENIKALQSVGQIIGEVLKQLDDERCTWGALTQAILCASHAHPWYRC
jgi:26S proteasome regulatory subunit T4